MGISSKPKKALRCIRLFKDWPALLGLVVMYKLGRAKTAPGGEAPRTLEMRDGTKLLIREKTHDWIIVWEIFINETYGVADGHTSVLQEIRADDVVVDIGAHIGIFTIYAARKAREGRVLAFEPDAENYAMLTRNLALNPQLAHVSAFNQAIWSSEGKRNLFRADGYWSGGHSLFENWMDDYSAGEGVEEQVDQTGAATIEVECTTLPRLMEANGLDRIDFLKVDCEGSEYEILLNLPEEELLRIKSMSLEYHAVEGFTGQDLADRLAGSGYAVEKVGSELIGYINASLTEDGAGR